MIRLKHIGKVLAGLAALIALWLVVAALVYSPLYVGRGVGLGRVGESLTTQVSQLGDYFLL